MRSTSIMSLLSAAALTAAQSPTTGSLGNATIVENNPPGVVYRATLPDTAFFTSAYPAGGNVRGSVAAVASPNGIGVLVKVQFSNLPKEGGPFPYHIHVNPVGADGNCTNTLAHLDPYIRGEDPTCNKLLPQTCQVGDLSGKHGTITSDPFEVTYLEQFASTVDGIGAFFGNRSFVVHFANKTRITCANFQKVTDESPSDFTTPSCEGTTAAATSTGVTVVTAVSTTFTSTFTSITASNATTAFTGAATPSQTHVTVSGANGKQNLFASLIGTATMVAAVMLML